VNTVINPDREEYNEEKVLGLAALLEVDSSHPIANAFSGTAVDRGQIQNVTNHENGVRGRVGNTLFRLGNTAFTGVNVIDINSGYGRIWLTDEKGWIARFDLDDGLRTSAVETIAALKARGLELIILSGDHEKAVASVASRTGIKRWYAEQNPKMKMDFLQSLQADGKNILMVGDGINDAPVLSAANVSMTVSGASELANSTADFIITGKSLIYLINIFKTGDKTHAVIRQNLFWALVYNLLAVPFAAAGMIVPWMAALGMSLSSLLVVLNSGRLAKRTKNDSTPVNEGVLAH
jgi:Cu2+-exporting ATPase